jgi:hypothetical protein
LLKQFFLAFRENVEPSIQDPTNKESLGLQNTVKNRKGGKLTEVIRRD